MTKGKGRGWHDDSKRHADAARGIKTTLQDIRSGKARRQFGLDTSSGSRYALLREQGYSDEDAQAIIFGVVEPLKTARALAGLVSAADMNEAIEIFGMLSSTEESESKDVKQDIQKAADRMEAVAMLTIKPLGKRELKRAYDYVDEYLDRAYYTEENKWNRLELDSIQVEVKKARSALGVVGE